jgi:hypothetical protein
MTWIFVLFILTISNPLYAGVITFNDTVELDNFSTDTTFTNNRFNRFITSTDKNYFSINLPIYDSSLGKLNHALISYEISYQVKFSVDWSFDKPFQGGYEDKKINNSFISIYSFNTSFDDNIGYSRFSSIGVTCYLTGRPIYNCSSERNFTDKITSNLKLNGDDILKLSSQSVPVQLTSRIQGYVPSNDWFNNYGANLAISLQFSNWHNGISEVRYSYEDKVIAVDEPHTNLLLLMFIFLCPVYKLTKENLNYKAHKYFNIS